MPTPSQAMAAIHHDMAKRLPALIESARIEERDRILGLCEYFREQHDESGPEQDLLDVLMDDICSGADNIFRDPPKPGPHVSGGPPPKPNERTEADYLREEVREVKTAQNKLWRVVNGLIETVQAHAAQLENVWQEIAALRSKPDDAEILPGMHAHLKAHAPEAAPPAQEEANATNWEAAYQKINESAIWWAKRCEELSAEIATLRPTPSDDAEYKQDGETIALLRADLATDRGPSVCVICGADHSGNVTEPCRVFVRDACRKRTPLGGTDAQCLEHALTMTEQERDEARAALKAEQAAHAETCDLLNAHNAAFCEARAKAIEDAARVAAAETLAHAVMRDGNADDYSAVLEAALDAWRTPQDPADA